MAQGKIKRSHVALRHEMVLKILRNLTRYNLPMEEMEKFRVALTSRLTQVLKIRPNGGKQLKIVIGHVLEAIKKMKANSEAKRHLVL